MGARMIFSRGEQIRGIGTKVPQRGRAREAGVKLPEADDSL